MQIVAVYILYRTIVEPFSGLFGPFVGIVISAAMAALAAFGVTSVSSGPLGILIAGLTATLVAVIVGLILNRIFKLGLLSRLTEPFPSLVQIIGDQSGEDLR
jgi:hypothetical protein